MTDSQFDNQQVTEYEPPLEVPAVTDLPDPWQGIEVRPRVEREQEPEPETDTNALSLSADDAGADADLPRATRAERQKHRRRTRFSTAIPALLLIGVGVFALVQPQELTTDITLALTAGIVLLAVLLRFLFNARRERGLFFISVNVILVAAFVIMGLMYIIDFSIAWPLLISIPGAAMIVTFVFERSHDRGLLLPGLVLIAGGLFVLPFTTGYLDTQFLADVALYWPVLLLVLALAILPRAVRDRIE